MLYRYVARRIPGPNTGNFSFEPVQALPCESILGPGYSPIRQINSAQPIQIQWLQALVQRSLEGIVHGTPAAQPIVQGAEKTGNL